ncbi:hypothetical protein LZC95_17335 [Pendulispora brunnea]|uniref:Uncharacterized protein n=1 Tax=Pendulispora brunnea TaxID=2905690 RepID=A0ABZ2KIS4_9BACT
MTRTLLPWLLLDVVLLAVILQGIRLGHPGDRPSQQPIALQPESKHYLP